MCDQNSLQRHIRRLTNNGEVVARFLTETVQGKTPGAKACHQVKAMEYLVRFGLTDQPDQQQEEDRQEDKFWGLIPTPEELATKQNTPSPSTGEGRDGGENPTHPANPVSPVENPQLTTQDSELNTDNSPDCYYEPLSPEDQAIFAYQTLIETGEYKEGEIEIQPPTEAAHQEYQATLKWMRQAAAEEGIPLLPNPLSGTLKRPTARSP